MNYFTDPIVGAPTVGCIFMCIAASLMGVVLLLQKRLLIGETVAHAAYPGALLGLFALSFAPPEFEAYAFLSVLAGAFSTAWLGARLTQKLWRLSSDAALCAVLALFFGGGILIASFLQNFKPLWRAQVDMLLFGQAATLTDLHVALFAGLALLSVLFVALNWRVLQAFLFDASFANAIGLPVQRLERLLFWLLLGSIVVGIRSVGVVLISGMLIAPAIAARMVSPTLKACFIWAAILGGASGLLGNILSVEVALHYHGVNLPTGPAIVLVGSSLALLALLFAPKRGAAVRLWRRLKFSLRCLEENILKELWKRGELWIHSKNWRRRLVFARLVAQGWAARSDGRLLLTADGQAKAATIVRLHRLWEVYLTEQLGVQAEKVHASAEEMEHILTPELEERLSQLLGRPETDPHQQPIPKRRGAR